jgi:hypothetical protein
MDHVERADIDPNTDAVVAAQPRTPEERLEISRAAMRASLAEYYQRNRTNRLDDPPAPEDPEPEWLKALSDAMSDRPLVAIAMRWLRSWWHNHPWRTLADLSGEVLHEVVTPVARRHPWLLLGGAAVAGVAIASLRPWRWISGGTLVAGLLPSISLASILAAITQGLDMFHAGDEDPSDESASAATTSDNVESQGPAPAGNDIPPASPVVH